ncbi:MULTISPECIES: glycoside hydrolase family 3 protein [Hungatella]|uniref:beta-N-acetylhexosaminidase n=1 Tax=Hungatella hathewayi TaxID=154046 RepID=A0A3E4TQC2_9FIRM|nr:MULTISPECIES: glycoside hydrolase family 3 protein [Hungatella]RGL92927.1 glycoside hydrolase family 3 [Hungatella hathewayi]
MQKRVLIGLTGALILLLTACSAKGGGTSMDAESNRSQWPVQEEGTTDSSMPGEDGSASLSAEASTSPLTKEDSSNPAPSDPSPDSADPTLQSLLSQMTLHEKVCQMLVVTPESITGVEAVTAAGDTTKKALQAMPVGGILYSKPNLRSKEQVKTMLQNTQSYSAIPLMFTCDEEGGRVNRLMSTLNTTMIGPMLDYKDQGVEIAYKNACTIASDMSALGFNADMAPVADVWSNPENTVIGDRAYSDDFQQAAVLVASAVEGFHAGGVATVLKHFPGHGDTSEDTHYGAVFITKTLEEIREKELLPFQAGIQADSDMVMIGHLILSDIDDQPAPFSHKIVTELLRQELGFDGVIITDGLQMKAMTDFYSDGEIACSAVKAGVDMLLCPANPEEAAAALEDAVINGDLTESRIEESVLRILKMKKERGMIP